MSRRAELRELVDGATASLTAANQARETGLAACRRVIRVSGSAIRAVHRLDVDEASTLIAEAERALREAQDVLEPHPAVAYAGFLTDAEKEFVEAKLTFALVQGTPLPSAADLAVMPASWLKGAAEAASEMRRHLLDRLRAGDLDHGEELLVVMDDVYDALITVDFPDAITGGLRRTLDALRAVLERTRGDVTTTVLQTRLREAIESSVPPG
ncbi:MAG: translin [Acidimicrobiaceae bacterium]